MVPDLLLLWGFFIYSVFSSYFPVNYSRKMFERYDLGFLQTLLWIIGISVLFLSIAYYGEVVLLRIGDNMPKNGGVDSLHIMIF